MNNVSPSSNLVRLLLLGVFGVFGWGTFFLVTNHIVEGTLTIRPTNLLFIAVWPGIALVALIVPDFLLKAKMNDQAREIVRMGQMVLNTLVIGVDSGLGLATIWLLVQWNYDPKDNRLEPLIALVAFTVAITEYIRQRFNVDEAVFDIIDNHENE